MKSTRVLPLVGMLVLVVTAPAVAAEPTVRNVNVRGLQIGGTTTLTIEGDDLGKAPRLLLPFPAKQLLQPKSTEKQAVFDVTVDDAPPGYHHLRVVTESGISLPVLIGVDRLPQKILTATTDVIPIALHGTLTGSSTIETAFNGKAGQKVIVEVEAHRLGSKLRPVLHLFGPKRLQLAWSWGNPALQGDTRLETTLPADGTYTITVHDAEYAGPGPGHFRLRIGQWNYADAVFPPVVGRNTTSVELIGNTPARIDLTTSRNPFQPLPWPKEGSWSGPRPFVESSNRTELLPGDGNMAAMFRVGPFAVSERIEKPFDEAKFRLPITPGSKVRFEVFAERIGSPLDATLVLRNDAGAELARAEDGPGTLDPVLEYTVPSTVTAVVVGVVDSQGRGGVRAVYRLTVDSIGGARPGDFRLTTPIARITMPVAGRCVMPVFAERQGYNGKIDVVAGALPTGLKADGAKIAADEDGALITISGTPDNAAITTWQGQAETGMLRPLLQRGHPMERLQPWLAAEVAISPTTVKATDFAIEWRGLADTAGLVPATKLALPIKVTRLETASPVRLTLLTSQLPPVVNGQPDASRSIRVEKPVELAAKVADGELTLLLPNELPASAYQIAVQAELLSADKQRVLATAFTPVKRLPVRMPFAIKLQTSTTLEAKLDPKTGAVVELTGEISRAEGFTGDVNLSLGILPAGVPAVTAVVKAGETKFTLKLVLPPNAAPGIYPGLKLSGNAITDPKQPGVRVKSREVELILAIK